MFGAVYPTNPRLELDEAVMDVVTLWRWSRGNGAAAGHLPEAGGVNDQAAWLLEAFAIMDGAYHELNKRGEQ